MCDKNLNARRETASILRRIDGVGKTVHHKTILSSRIKSYTQTFASQCQCDSQIYDEMIRLAIKLKLIIGLGMCIHTASSLKGHQTCWFPSKKISNLR